MAEPAVGVLYQQPNDMAPAPGPAPAPSVKSEDDEPILQRPLNVFDVACLIINKMIGSGIFIQPSNVLYLTGVKYGALLLWVFGAIYSFCSIYIYLEYGLAWPYTGGEFFYITKIFPRPTLLLACSFAWFFVGFSTSTGNALIFARYLCLTGTANPDVWLQKFIACWIVVGICIIHYRTVNIGINANAFLAVYKVLLLLILVLAGIIGGFIHERKHVEGTGDYGRPPPQDTDRSLVNVALALFLVLYSYQGWENANYITAEIEGDEEHRRQTLKLGALWAVSIVSGLYISFNLLLFFLLDFNDITTGSVTVAYHYVLRAFGTSNEAAAQNGIFACIALSACGNLVGVIFTNARVKRDIARLRLIPGYSFFQMSSKHGRSQDGFGTPSGGLILHGIVSCATIAATPFFQQNATEGLSFVINLFTYGHSVLGVVLGFGLFFLKKRMDENQTKAMDLPGESYDVPWNYKLLKKRWVRNAAASFFITINGYLIVIPFVPSNNPDGTHRVIPSWKLPASTLAVYAAGAVAGLVIVVIAPRMSFKTSKGRSVADFVPYGARRWIIEYPRFDHVLESWRVRGGKRIVFRDAKKRLWREGEAQKARELRGDTQMERLVNGQQHEN